MTPSKPPLVLGAEVMERPEAPVASTAAPPETGAIGAEVGRGRPVDWWSRSAAIAFGVYLVVALLVLILYFGAPLWFWGDDFGMMFDRSLTDVDGLLRPENGHWSTFPVVVYHLLYDIVGLDHFWSYQLVVVVLHLATCVMVRVFMRRAGVDAWLATVAAGTLVLFGTAMENLLLPVQMNMVGSLFFGMVMLLCWDHDGPFSRRDLLGSLFGLAALMSSGMGPPMIAGVGVAVLLRRGWRSALVATLPLGIVYAVWYQAYSDTIERNTLGRPSAGRLASWVESASTGVFVGMGQWPVVGVLLAGLLVAGCALAWRQRGWARIRVELAAPLGLIAAGSVVILATGWQRWVMGDNFARSPRYMGIAAACLLPLLAVAGDAIVRSRRWTLVPVSLLLLVGVPGNIDGMGEYRSRDQYYDNQEALVLGMAYSPRLDDLPEDHRPDSHPFTFDNLTVGHLRATRDAGLLPPEPELTQAQQDEITVRFGVSQSRDPLPWGTPCEERIEPLTVDGATDPSWALGGKASITLVADGEWVGPVVYDATWGGPGFRLLDPATDAFVGPAPGQTTFTVCG